MSLLDRAIIATARAIVQGRSIATRGIAAYEAAKTAAAAPKPGKPVVLAGKSSALTASTYGTPPSGAHVEAQFRVLIDWTPALLRSALTSADGGNLRTAADLCDAILGDDRAPAVLGTRANALLGSELTFEPGTGRRKKKALKSAEADEDWWNAFPEDELSQLLIWGILLGVGLGELIWIDDPETGRAIPRLKVWHPRHLRYDWTARSWMLRVDGGDEIPISAGDGKWVIYTPYGAQRPWARGLWRGMGMLWLAKDFARRDFALTQEIHGQGLLVGTAPTPALRQELVSMLRDLGRSSVFAIPPMADLKVVETQARNWEMYTAQIDIANVGFSIMAIGTSLPTEVGDGVATGATASSLVRLDYKKNDGMSVATTLRNQALVWWAEFNFGNKSLAPWPEWQVEPPADKTAEAARWLTLAQALSTANPDKVYDFDMAEVEEAFDVTITEGEKAKPPAPVIAGGPDASSAADSGDPATESDGQDAPDAKATQPIDKAASEKKATKKDVPKPDA